MPSVVKEIEVKARIKNLNRLLSKLEELGCLFSNPSTQNDIVFLPKGLQYKDIVPGTNVLRIREQGEKVTFTLKQRSKIELAKVEREIEVNNASALVEIIKLLEFEEVVRINKLRRTGKYRDYTICLDEVEGLGTFIEVEKVTDDDEVQTQEDMLRFLETLGIEKEAIEDKGYDTLLLN